MSSYLLVYLNAPPVEEAALFSSKPDGGESALWREQQQPLVHESVGCSVTTAQGAEQENKGTSQNNLIQESLRKAEPQAHWIMQIIVQPPKQHLKAWTARGKGSWRPCSSSELGERSASSCLAALTQ